MTVKTDWLTAALNNVAPNPNGVVFAQTVGTYSSDPSEDGGRYGGGASDYTVWK